jgi:Zn-dependent M28 family amino/carboxypeptidase
VEKIGTENVLGYIEGTDKKQELIVITAHYDHDGISTPVKGDSIYNGADDDASGTVAVMELAQAFALAKQKGDGSRRSLLFLAVSAEEKGLLGSSYYVEHPLFPLQNTVTNINIDMIGRRDSTHVGKADYLYVVGADRLSGELHRVNEAVNTHYLKLNFDYKYNAKDDPENVYERSDHYNFAKKNIPVVFFTSGLHPDYHTPFDTADKIEYEALQKRTQMIFYLAWELSNRENKVKLDSMTEKQP